MKVRSKQEFEAIQVTNDDFERIAGLLGGYATRTLGGHRKIHSPVGLAWVGDWIIETDDGWAVVQGDDFAKQFEPSAEWQKLVDEQAAFESLYKSA